MFTERSACDDAADDPDACRLDGRADFGDEPPIPKRIPSWFCVSPLVALAPCGSAGFSCSRADRAGEVVKPDHFAVRDEPLPPGVSLWRYEIIHSFGVAPRDLLADRDAQQNPQSSALFRERHG